MKYLLDTCAFIWLAKDSKRLSKSAISEIVNPENDGAISVLSLWEISMKVVRGKLDMPGTPEALASRALQSGLSVIPLTVSQIEVFHHLSARHPDPFDRLLAAVAIEGGYTLLSPELSLDTLGVRRVW